MILDPKALEAAGKQLRLVCGKIAQIFDQRNPPSPQEWDALYKREAKTIFDAANLVPREENEATVNCLLRERNAAEAERDEARAQVVELQALIAKTNRVLEPYIEVIKRAEEQDEKQARAEAEAAAEDTR